MMAPLNMRLHSSRGLEFPGGIVLRIGFSTKMIRVNDITHDCVRRTIIMIEQFIRTDRPRAISVRVGLGQTDSVQTDLVQTNSVQTDLVQTDSVQTDMVKTDMVKTDSVRTDMVRTDSVRTDMVRTDSVQTDMV